MTTTQRADAGSVAARGAGAATSLGAVIATALLPKCPLCIAVLLSGSGFGIATAHAVARAARPGLVLLALASALLLLWVERKPLTRALGDRTRWGRASDGAPAVAPCCRDRRAA